MSERPIWIEEFPAAQVEEQKVTRRQLLKVACLASVAAAGTSVVGAVTHRQEPAPAPRVAIARVEDVPVGGSVSLHYPAPGNPAILIRLAPDRFVAYDRRCTHLRCPVLWRPAEGRLHCPCHAGAFDAGSGKPLAGPPVRPLPRIALEVVDGVVYAIGKEPAL